MVQNADITVSPNKIRNELDNGKTHTVVVNKPCYSDYSQYSRPGAFVRVATQNDLCGCSCCRSCCPCYEATSYDARCCGACYFFCPLKIKEEQCNICPNNFTEYWDSGYVQTTAGYGKHSNNEEKNGFCCWFCFSVKFPMFFSCCFGSLCNGCINCMRKTNLNYLV